MDKLVFFFGEGKAEGTAKMRDLLGGKGANLAEMTNLGIPVPPGFTISTEVCRHYHRSGGEYPPGLEEEVEKAFASHKLAVSAHKRKGDWITLIGQRPPEVVTSDE